MKYIFGNWKMYLDLAESEDLSRQLAAEDLSAEKLKLAVFPTALATAAVVDNLAKIEIAVGAQNVSWVNKGGYTGAISAQMFKDAGCQYALVGHSERRHIFGETDEDARKKLEACLEAGLTPVLCLGETKAERDGGQREARLKKQLYGALADLRLNGGKILLAYEPVWAIGTDDNCDALEAAEVQQWIKKEIQQYQSASLPVLYGGSVKAENVLSYVSLEAIDGVLVGGASAKLETFLSLIKTVINYE